MTSTRGSLGSFEPAGALGRVSGEAPSSVPPLLDRESPSSEEEQAAAAREAATAKPSMREEAFIVRHDEQR